MVDQPPAIAAGTMPGGLVFHLYDGDALVALELADCRTDDAGNLPPAGLEALERIAARLRTIADPDGLVSVIYDGDTGEVACRIGPDGVTAWTEDGARMVLSAGVTRYPVPVTFEGDAVRAVPTELVALLEVARAELGDR